MFGSVQYSAYGLTLLVFFCCACGKNSNDDGLAIDHSEQSQSLPNESKTQEVNKNKSATKDEIPVVHLRNNSETEFQGSTISNLDGLPIKISRLLFKGNLKEDLSTEIAFSADQKTTLEQLKKTLISFQLYGFQNLRIRCGDVNVKIPIAVANNSKKPNFYVQTIIASQDGEFCGMKIERLGKTSWLESGDVEHAIKHTGEMFQTFIKEVESKSDGTTQEIEIEIKSTGNVDAKTFMLVCGELHSLAQAHGESSAVSIRLWPLGYPREQPLNIGSPDEFLPIELDK